MDLTAVYAFCHVTKDMIANEHDVEKKKRKCDLIEKFVNEMFVDRRSVSAVGTKAYSVKIDWNQYRSELTDAEMASFRCLSRIAFYLPRKPFDGLLEGFRWDIDGKPIKNEDDLMLYSNYVAGTIGVLCVYAILYRSDSCEFDPVEKFHIVVEKAQQMGIVSMVLVLGNLNILCNHIILLL